MQESRPARARGLKHFRIGINYAGVFVAPRTGAWIETLQPRRGQPGYRSRPALREPNEYALSAKLAFPLTTP
jgi:hypothetical protein